jgi:hypothetical protein
MTDQHTYWKNLSLNMLCLFQGLFLASTTWDFFLTVVVHSHRALVFAGLSTGTAAFIILPWITGIFIMAAMLVAFMISKEKSVMSTRINFEYGGMICVYLVLFFMAMFNPVVAWPIVMNYLVNAVWAASLIYYKIAIRNCVKSKNSRM